MSLGNRMIDTTNPALHQRPEAVDGLCVDISAHVHLLCVANAAMVISALLERVINRVFVCEDSGLWQHILFDVGHHRGALNVRRGHSHNTALALDYPKHSRFVRSINAGTALAS